jgi:hypothetical protein
MNVPTADRSTMAFKAETAAKHFGFGNAHAIASFVFGRIRRPMPPPRY